MDLARARQLVLGEVQLGYLNGAGFEGDAPAQSVGDGLGLLVDLLQHEVAVAALLRGHRVPGDPPDGAGDRAPLRVQDAEPVGPDLGDLAVFHKGHVTRVLQQRRDVRGDEGLPVARAHDDGRGVLGDDEPLRVAPAEEHQGVGAVDLPDGLAHRVEQIHPPRGLLLGQVGDELGVGIRGQRRATPEQGLLEFQVVLDDAVVHHNRVAGPVRVGVGLGRASVGGPAGVADAGMPLDGRAGEERFKAREFALGAPQRDAAAVQDGDTGRVVAPVLQLPQAIDQHRGGVAPADISYDSAHGPLTLRTLTDSASTSAGSAWTSFPRNSLCQNPRRTRNGTATPNRH